MTSPSCWSCLNLMHRPRPACATQGGLSGTLAQPTTVSTTASTLGSGQALLPPLNGSSGGGLVSGGSALVNSASVYGRSSYCPNLGWIYAADPYRCAPVFG